MPPVRRYGASVSLRMSTAPACVRAFQSGGSDRERTIAALRPEECSPAVRSRSRRTTSFAPASASAHAVAAPANPAPTITWSCVSTRASIARRARAGPIASGASPLDADHPSHHLVGRQEREEDLARRLPDDPLHATLDPDVGHHRLVLSRRVGPL